MARGDSLLFNPVFLQSRPKGSASFDQESIILDSFPVRSRALALPLNSSFLYLDNQGGVREVFGHKKISVYDNQKTRKVDGNNNGFVWQKNSYLIEVQLAADEQKRELDGIPYKGELEFFLSKTKLYAFNKKGDLFSSSKSYQGIFHPWQSESNRKVKGGIKSPRALLLRAEADRGDKVLFFEMDGSVYQSEDLGFVKEDLLFASSAPGQIVYLNEEEEVLSFSFAIDQEEEKEQVLFQPRASHQRPFIAIEADQNFIYLLDDTKELYLYEHSGRLLDSLVIPFLPRGMELIGEDIFLFSEKYYNRISLSRERQ